MRKLNPLVTNGLSHPYHLDESIFILGTSGVFFFIFISFFDENRVSKQNSLRWDAVFCGVTSGGPQGFKGSGEKGFFIFRELGSTANYFRGAGEQAHTFGDLVSTAKK